MKKKQYFKKSKIQQLMFLLSRERADFLRKSGWFHSFGDAVYGSLTLIRVNHTLLALEIMLK